MCCLDKLSLHQAYFVNKVFIISKPLKNAIFKKKMITWLGFVENYHELIICGFYN